MTQPNDLPRRDHVSWDAARRVAHLVGRPQPAVSRALADAAGCVLASPLVSPAAVPPVDRSAMDGYAVRGPGPWRVIAHVAADSAASVELADGQACSITTGAAVPAGATSVIRDEDIELDGPWVHGPSDPGKHIRRAGEECQAGEVVLPAGVVVDGPVLGLAASLGLNRLTVIPQPVVAALITGDELVHQGPSTPGRVRDAIGPMLPTLITQAGAQLGPIRHLPDTRTALLEALRTPRDQHPTPPHPTAGSVADSLGGAEQYAQAADTGLRGERGTPPHPSPSFGDQSGVPPHPNPGSVASGVGGATPGAAGWGEGGLAGADLILVSGSSASGPADHLRAVLSELGAELVVDGVDCRPGHPQAVARLGDGRLVVGLPGNPLAALSAFLTVGVAAISRLRGLPLPALAVAAIPGGVACHPHSTRLVPVRVTGQGAVPVGHGGSAMLRGAAEADALAVVEPGPAEAIAARLLPLDPGARPWGG
ncbi:molybdopterin molybdotransferase MoeA [Kribbella sp. NPDC056951]|uniref:molybdopterin molybdotransferase MoeA n=1 Tax=Kribbella sp. NPDC056951 TaxID=3345978 RepID=UPI00362FB489